MKESSKNSASVIMWSSLSSNGGRGCVVLLREGRERKKCDSHERKTDDFGWQWMCSWLEQMDNKHNMPPRPHVLHPNVFITSTNDGTQVFGYQLCNPVIGGLRHQRSSKSSNPPAPHHPTQPTSSSHHRPSRVVLNSFLPGGQTAISCDSGEVNFRLPAES